MKILLLALAALSVEAKHHRHSHSHHGASYPEQLGGKNSQTVEESWAEYHKNRPTEHDCSLNESLNWHGNHMCRFSWECKGARVCEINSYNDPGTNGIGWCRGPDACPLIGPLDSYDEDHDDPSKGLKLNPGSTHRRDLEEWED